MQPTTPDFLAWAQPLQLRMETVLESVLPDPSIAPARLHQAMRYAVLNGGKRMRPLVSFAAGELSQAPQQRVELVAASVELIHSYSLVHDDLPCMDNDTLRRGKPTCHVQYDEATALLVGDSLQSLAYQILSDRKLTDDARLQVEMMQTLALASGSRGMAGGQAIDLESTGKPLTLPELEFMHIQKTGALIRAAVLLGLYCGKSQPDWIVKAIDHYAKCMGLAFQVVDDLLDNSASSATLGKTPGKDVAQDKPTYVSVLGESAAHEWVEQLYKDALAALEPLGDSARRLRQMANFITQRKS